MSLIVTKPGIASSVQDWGRYGYQHLGLATAGPADEHAFLWANKLLDNPAAVAQIEICMGVFSCEFTLSTRVALCGAEASAQLNGKPIAQWRSFAVTAGDRLECQYARTGMRSYLAVAGGFQVAQQLNSCATLQREGLGAHLQAGDCLGYNESLAALREKSVPPAYVPTYAQQIELAVVPGYQWDSFTETQQDCFFAETFSVSKNADRMGHRLDGAPIQTELDGIISEGIAYGAIQIPADGLPIILGKDRQSIGGYPKLGCVTRQSMNRLAQAQAGTSIRFYQQSIAEAAEQWEQCRQFFGI